MHCRSAKQPQDQKVQRSCTGLAVRDQAARTRRYRIFRVQMPRAHPRWGIEFDWLGVDREGHVAVFTTAGYGLVPADVNQHLADVDAALDRVKELPVTGSAGDIIRRSAGGDYPDWYAYSAKGFYAYDWQVWHGPYQRLSAPTAPISIGQLPAARLAIACFAEFLVSFADEPEITVEYVEPSEAGTGQMP